MENSTAQCLLPGETGGYYEIYSGGKTFDRMEIEVNAISEISNSVTAKYQKWSDVFDVSTSFSSGNATVEVKNKTDMDLKPRYVVVFYKKGSPVWVEWEYNDSIDSGKRTVHLYEPENSFDSIKVFFEEPNL